MKKRRLLKSIVAMVALMAMLMENTYSVMASINADNIAQLSGTGIAGAAVVSAIFAQKDIKKAAANLRQLIAKEL